MEHGAWSMEHGAGVAHINIASDVSEGRNSTVPPFLDSWTDCEEDRRIGWGLLENETERKEEGGKRGEERGERDQEERGGREEEERRGREEEERGGREEEERGSTENRKEKTRREEKGMKE
eukprot:764007-Hanusia_phi.AAC.1